MRGRGLRDPAPAGLAPEYGLYLGGAALRRATDAALTWPHDWVRWPDFLLPRDTDDAVARIVGAYQRARLGQRVEVACGGGVGRTGTVLACLAVLAGQPVATAVDWTRAHHHRRAMETPWQRRWIRRFAELADPLT